MDEKIRAVLEFYANPKHYALNTDPYAAHDSAIAEDSGKKAREIIAWLDAAIGR